MSDIETVERVIPAPPSAIFALLSDAARHKDFDGSGTVRETHGTPQPLRLGSVFGTDMHMLVPYAMKSTVVEFEPDRLIAWQPRPAYPLVGRLVGGRIWRYELEPVEGGTRVRESWDISQERVKALVRPLRSKTRSDMEKTLERLERLVTA